jgi:lipoprotein-anchoring transpeptidase ErfK/SrfK
MTIAKGFFLAFLFVSNILLAETIFYDEEEPTLPIIKELKHELIPLTKTVFKVVTLETGEEHTIDLTGKDFVIVSVREKGSDGRFYAVDSDGTVWWSGAVTSGAPEFRSPSGVFPIIQKKRYHMSNAYPDESGVNNMDYMMKFTRNGHALHMGSVDWMSHGCIHIDPKDVPVIYNWSTFNTKVVITRHSYMPFAKEDLRKIYLRR